MRALALLPFLFAAAGCWQNRYFTPRENVAGTGPDGQPAAIYTLVEQAGAAPFAEVRVWSDGASARFTEDDREVVELRVAFEVENNSEQPLRLDLASLACEDVMLDGVLQPTMVPAGVTGDGVAAPRTTARIDVVFEPATTRPRDLDSFAVRWVMMEGERKLLTQVTPFAPWVRPAADRGYWAPWGFGFGFGLGWHHSHWH